jgi:hypothetical protein
VCILARKQRRERGIKRKCKEKAIRRERSKKEWLAFLLHVREIPSSNIGPKKTRVSCL